MSKYRFLFLYIFLPAIYLITQVNIVRSQIPDLKSTENQADYLIISSKEFTENLSPLISLRESQNLKTLFVDVEAVYNQFQDTLSQKEAIRHFVSYTLEFWADPKPQYVILVGDVDIIPSYRVESRFIDTIWEEDSVSVDNHYAINLYEVDFLPDIAIGRLPVSTAQELDNIVNKILNFENNIKRFDYPMDYLGLADYREGELFFEDQCDEFVESVIPEYYRYHRIYRRSESIYHGTKDDIIENLNQGILFLNYHGHANPFILADTSFFYIDDLIKLEANKLPLMFLSATSSQSYDLKDTLCISEKLLFMKDGGAVISFAPSGLIYALATFEFIRGVYESLFANPHLSIGKNIMKVLNGLSVNIGSSPDDIILRFFLLGDPAMRLPEDLILSMTDPDPFIPDEFELISIYPNPFNASTTIRFSLKKPGAVKLDIYDVNGRLVEEFPQNSYMAGVHKIYWNPRNISSGVYYIVLNINQNIYTRKTVLLK